MPLKKSTSKVLIVMLLTESRYLRHRINHNNEAGFMLYEGNATPLRFFHEKNVKEIKDLLKKDKKGKLTLNLNSIRQLDGRSAIKKLYKKKLKTKAPLLNLKYAIQKRKYAG